MTDNSYQIYYDKYVKILKKNDYGVLATAYNTFVTTRTMYYELKDDYIYVLTHVSYFKNEQIHKNHNVSFTVLNVNIEGQISEVLDNNTSLQLYNKLRRTNYVTFNNDSELILYRIKPEVIKIWDNEQTYATRMFVYPRSKIATKQTVKQS